MVRRIGSNGISVGLVVFLFFVASIPAAAQDLKCFILTPPDQVLEGVKQIAVVDFSVTSSYKIEGKPGKKTDLDKILGTIETVSGAMKKTGTDYFSDSGEKLADLIIAQMVEADRGIKDVGSGFLGLGRKEGRTFQQGARTDVFVVVERSRLDEVLEELKLGQSGLVDEAQAAQVGQMLGVDAIITGQLNAACRDKWERETRTVKKTKTQVDCYKRSANVSAAIRIINVTTGQLMGTKDARARQDVKKCEGDYGKELPPAEQTIDVCLQSVAKQLTDYFLPTFKENKFEFAKVEGKEYKRFYELAKKHIENYDLDNAYLQYTAVVEKDPYNHAAIYNLGLLHEAVGNYDPAMEQFTMATKLVSKEKKYHKALQRVQKQQRFWQQLEALGLSLEPYDFIITTEQVQEATIPKIRMNGGGGDRYKVHAQPAEDSEVLIRVPGAIELEFIGIQGDWYKVKLLDGSEGYIHKDHAKPL
ncbi:SH3 domain-containing protein [candidate division KSB1 bacterium]|nr:SH3 domain-containing protein [candidate division KSB1 bacterium]